MDASGASSGRIRAWFRRIHVTLFTGIIGAAVGDDLAIHHPATTLR
jgi:hypothetical protein